MVRVIKVWGLVSVLRGSGLWVLVLFVVKWGVGILFGFMEGFGLKVEVRGVGYCFSFGALVRVFGLCFVCWRFFRLILGGRLKIGVRFASACS